MIRIIHQNNGKELDLRIDQEFDIELDNPMFETDALPVPFSTSIEFPATENNRDILVFSGVPGHIPSVTEFPAVLVFGGVPLFIGEMTFEGIEDGFLAYTFAAKDVDADWQDALYEIGGLSSSDYGSTFINSIESGSYSEIKAPLLVNEDNTADRVYPSTYGGDDGVGIAVKYQNFPNVTSFFVPAVSLSLLIRKATGDRVTIDSSLTSILRAIMILAEYRGDDEAWNRTSARSVNVADMLPDMTISDFMLSVCKLLCLSVFYSGNGYILKALSDIVEADAEVDWSDKVADGFSVYAEEKQGYLFGYKEEDNSYDADSSDSADDPYEYQDINSFMAGLSGHTDYYAAKITDTGDIYSAKAVHNAYYGQYSTCVEYLSDHIYHNIGEVDHSSGYDSTWDSSVGWQLVRCVPVRQWYGSKTVFRMAPVVPNPPARGSEERSSDVRFGIWADDCLTDHGYKYTGAYDENSQYSQGEKVSEDMNASNIFSLYHEKFAEWLTTPRRRLSVDLDLSVNDISKLRLWHKVYIRGSVFVIKKLTLTFKSGSGRFGSQAELVSC